MDYLKSSGIGESLRSEHATTARVRKLVVKMLTEPCYEKASQKARLNAQKYDIKVSLPELIRNTQRAQN